MHIRLGNIFADTDNDYVQLFFDLHGVHCETLARVCVEDGKNNWIVEQPRFVSTKRLVPEPTFQMISRALYEILESELIVRMWCVEKGIG